MNPTTPPEAETPELIAQYAELARTPLCKPNAIALRREGRAGLAALGLPAPAEPLERRRRWNATSHVRERLPRR